MSGWRRALADPDTAAPEEVEQLREAVVHWCIDLMFKKTPWLTLADLSIAVRSLNQQVQGWSIEELIERARRMIPPAATH